MIRISTRGRYALRAMVDLAQHSAGGPVLRQDIAKRQAISAAYVAQLCRRLQSAGLVEGVKGPGGGYQLARDPASISARDVIEAVEGPIALVHCILERPGEKPLCDRVDHCVTHLLWKQLSETVTGALQAISVQDLAEQAQHLAQQSGRLGAVPNLTT